MVRKLLLGMAVILAIVYKFYGFEAAKYIALMVSSGCIGSIVQEVEEK